MAYPAAQEAQALTQPAFEAFCREHRYGRANLISRRYAHLMEPAPEASPIAVAAYRDQIRILAELLLPQVLRRTEARSSLAQLFSQHPDAFIFDSRQVDAALFELLPHDLAAIDATGLFVVPQAE
jgi:hypothetical protein